MRCVIRRLAIILAAALAPLAFVTLVSPGVSNADCGFGTVYDAASDSCVAAPQPTPPPPGDLTPGFSAGFCAPVPFVSICTGI
jgi:hypothetical protein